MLTGVLLWILVYKLSLVPRLSRNANMYRHMYMRYIAIYICDISPYIANMYPRLHNFNAYVPERRSLGTRLMQTVLLGATTEGQARELKT